MKYRIPLICLLIACLLCTGCAAKKPAESPFTYITYDRASDYHTGRLAVDAGKVTNVVIHWLSGSIVAAQSADGSLSCAEQAEGLSDQQTMHWMLDGATLHIHYCASGYIGTMPHEKKTLTMTLPEGINVHVDSTSASLKMDSHTLGRLSVSTVSGSTAIKAITADSLSLSSTSGSVSIDTMTVAEQAVFSTVSGSVRAGRVDCPQVEVHSTSGGADLGLARCSSFCMNTVSGSTAITLLDGLTASVSFSTVSGKQTGSYTEGDGCAIAVSSTSGGLKLTSR